MRFFKTKMAVLVAVVLSIFAGFSPAPAGANPNGDYGWHNGAFGSIHVVVDTGNHVTIEYCPGFVNPCGTAVSIWVPAVCNTFDVIPGVPGVYPALVRFQSSYDVPGGAGKCRLDPANAGQWAEGHAFPVTNSCTAWNSLGGSFTWYVPLATAFTYAGSGDCKNPPSLQVHVY